MTLKGNVANFLKYLEKVEETQSRKEGTPSLTPQIDNESRKVILKIEFVSVPSNPPNNLSFNCPPDQKREDREKIRVILRKLNSTVS